jgi:hypothetical protein
MRSIKPHKRALLLAVAAVLGLATDTGPLMLGNGTAEAVIGRPLTPASYAGVARRTTRRAAYAGASNAAYAAPVVSSSTVVTTLPSGCTQIPTSTGVIYQCGSASYTPSYNGTTVVYHSN